MATIHNSDLSKELVRGARIQQLVDKIPNELLDKVTPVMEVNPRLLRIANIISNGSLTNATSGTVYTTPSDKDFYLVQSVMGYIKDATSTSVLLTMRATIDGANKVLISMPSITLTADSGQFSCTYPIPIKIDRGTNITVQSSTNVANVLVTGNIIGYTVDNPNA